MGTDTIPDMVIVDKNDDRESDGSIYFEDLKVIAYKPQIANWLGSIEAAIYFQQLSHWQKYAKRQDGFIYKSAREIEEETCISERTQRRCRDILVRVGWIEVKKVMANGSLTYHFKVLVRSFGVMAPTGKTPIATGKTPIAIGKNASSITKNTHENTQTYGPKEEEQMLALHKGYIKFFKINTDQFNYADPETQNQLIESALKRYNLTPERIAKLHTRLQDAGFATIKQAIINANKSDWNHGTNPSGWTMDLYKYLLRSYEQVEDWANRK